MTFLPLFWGPPSFVAFGHTERKTNHERGPFTQSALHLEFALLKFNESLCDGQTQAHAFVGDPQLLLGALLKGQQDALQIGLGNARSGVSNGQTQARTLVPCGLALDLTLGGELEGVGEEVVQDLDQPPHVSKQDFGHGIRHLHGQGVARGLGPACKPLGHTLQHPAALEFHRLGLGLS